jgi:hypothetical protein
MSIADRADLPTDERQDVVYVSLLRFVGCTGTHRK